MAQLLTVPVSRIKPNPYRDGRGSATWASLKDTYPINPDKAARLKESMLHGGVFEGVIAREAAAETYQLAFGHHRVTVFQGLVAAGLIDDGFPLIVKALTDAEMVSYMARENSEEDGHTFTLAVINPVEAAITAYGAGKVDLKEPGPKARGVRLTSGGQKPYTSESLSEFLGVTRTKVEEALRALDTVESGIITRKTYRGLPQSAVDLVVQVANSEHKRVAGDFTAKAKIRRETADAASAAGDRDKATEERKVADTLDATVEKSALRAAKNASEHIAQRVRDGWSVRELKREMREPVPEDEDKDITPAEAVVKLIKALDKVGRVDTKGWVDAKVYTEATATWKQRNAYIQDQTKRAREELASEMDRASRRLLLRVKDIIGGALP